ncbi:fungal fruit body lectin-domain-containing protein [Podospora conica]|nr:fungal fruit body lectin-domain-containing protein [Schizothecium conicum]
MVDRDGPVHWPSRDHPSTRKSLMGHDNTEDVDLGEVRGPPESLDDCEEGGQPDPEIVYKNTVPVHGISFLILTNTQLFKHQAHQNPLQVLKMSSYTINLNVLNFSSEELTLVEKTCWLGAGTEWERTDDGAILSMNASGTSGMLRFRTSGGDRFAVAVGVHNYKRWCDISADLDNATPLTKLHGRYYDDKDVKNKRLWAQDEKFQVTTKNGVNIKIVFFKEDGKALWARLEYGS